jgi:hypothetical protein
MGKGMRKNSYPYMDIGKLASKIFFYDKDIGSTYPVDNYPVGHHRVPMQRCLHCTSGNTLPTNRTGWLS